MKLTIRHLVLTGLVASSTVLGLTGCNATNDNPITPDKMNEIANKEAADRANFHPNGTPPPAATK